MHLRVRLRAGSAAGLSALAGLLVAATVSCGSPTVARRVAFVDSEGRAQFNSHTITITKGDTLKLTVGNRTDTRQQFTIEGAGTEHTVGPDEAVTVEIKAERSGTYRVYSASDQRLRPLTIVVPV
jgi:hypothetical protein